MEMMLGLKTRISSRLPRPGSQAFVTAAPGAAEMSE